MSNISDIDTGVNYVSGSNSSGLNVVSLWTDGSTSLVMSAYSPGTHDCWSIIDLKAPSSTVWGGLWQRRETRPARRIRMITSRTGQTKGGIGMPTYVSLLNWTDQGIKNFRQSTERAKDFTKLVEASGGKVRELVWTVGEYDLVTVADYPDEESAVEALLKVGAAGNIRSKTMRAFSAPEMEGIVARTS